MNTQSVDLQKAKSYTTRKRSRFVLSLWVSAIILSATVLSCTDEDKTDPNSPGYHIAESEKLIIPAEIDLPNSGNIRIATYYAKGVQIYNARQKAESNPVEYEWFFASPSAILFNDQNEQIGTHFAGPSWQLESGDRINAQPFTPAKIKNMDANSIDWLLLMPKTGSTPTGIFSDVTHIQRIATTGGKAPTTPPTSAFETIGVEYTAVYRFTNGN